MNSTFTLGREQREDTGKEMALDVPQTLLLILEDQEDPQF